MADQKPPSTTGDERATVLGHLQYQRGSFVRKVEGVSEDDARRSFVASGTTLLWLTRHLAFAEDIWLLRRFAGQPGVALANEVADDDTLAAAVAAYREGWARVDAVIAAAPGLDAGLTDAGTAPPVDLHWVLVHLLQETARHAGHADIIRELIDGTTGR